MQRSINKLSSLLLIDVSQSQPIVEPRAWLPFQAHPGLVTAVISIFRFPCLKPISSWPSLIGKLRPHLHIFESVEESKIMEAGQGWKAPGGLCLLGGAGRTRHPLRRGSGEGEGGITVIRNKKGTWPNLLPSGMAGESSVPCLALGFNRCLGKRRGRFWGASTAAHACPPHRFGERGVQHNPGSRGGPGRAGSGDTRLDPTLPSCPPRCLLVPCFPAKVLPFQLPGRIGPVSYSLRNWFQFNNFIGAVGHKGSLVPRGEISLLGRFICRSGWYRVSAGRG